ncbi:alpha-amylase 4N-like isoform X3 [Homalodisca vitripennis]|nr:alpha-amylase 4N-like isoform X3 [Homalodisca vitripennis]
MVCWNLCGEMQRRILVVLLVIAMTTGDKSLDLGKGVLVHLFEWTYPDIAKECEEFLAPKGFAGVQISPPSENLVSAGRPWWERYQPVSYRLITRSGTDRQLSDMLSRCNRVGVRVIADVVFNHMTGSPPDCKGVGGSTCDGRGLSYPAVPYTSADFHQPQCGIKDWNNPSQIWNCNLVGLHDLNQTREEVRQKVVDYLNNLIDLGMAGFRVDAAKHMDPSDLRVIYGRLKNLKTEHGFPPNTKPFIVQEVIDYGTDGVKYQEYTPLGLVTDFRFGKELGRCFQGRNDIKWLTSFGPAWNILPGDKTVVFIDNHDTERSSDSDIVNYKRSRSYKMAIAFMLSWGIGTPRVLSSFQFSDFNQGPPRDKNDNILSPRPIQADICTNGWSCQHRWRQIYNMVAFHNFVRGTEVASWWDNGKNQIAYCRGHKGFIAFNVENYPLNKKLQTCLPKGSYCDIISGNLEDGRCTGKTVEVGEDGTALITIGEFNPTNPDDGVLAIYLKVSKDKRRRQIGH